MDRIDENYVHNLSVCYRCGTPIEPLPSLQWFIDVGKKITIKGNKYFKNKSLKEAALEAVKSGEIKIIPKRFERTYFHWMKNLRDWCISRQIWFGHRIPVWYKKISDTENAEIYVGVEPPKGEGWRQDSDTLDTWFSSGLWTFSTLLAQDFKKYKTFEEWAKNSLDLKKFHPTSVMETGYDILFFWIARMILMTTYTLGEIPFETVYLHGLVRDKLGRKMSKSLGNGIDPVEMIDKYGTDALRMSMIVGSTPGNDTRLYEEKIAGYRNFVNKLWNISRYVLGAVDFEKVKKENRKLYGKTIADKWILGKSNTVFSDVAQKIENYEFSAAAEDLRNFTWNDFADWYLEIAKIEKNKEEILIYVLKNLLKLWHPFMPFVTEEIWDKFNNSLLMTEKFPELQHKKNKKSTEEFEIIRGLIRAIRNLRVENKIAASLKTEAVFITENIRLKKTIEDQKDIIKGLARLKNFTVGKKRDKIQKTASAFVDGIEVCLFFESATDSIDSEKELKKTEKQIKEAEKRVALINKNLADKNFLANAPQRVIEEFKKRHKAERDNIAKLNEKKKTLFHTLGKKPRSVV